MRAMRLVIVYWSVRLFFAVFAVSMCWLGGDCPDFWQDLSGEFRLIDVLVISLVLVITSGVLIRFFPESVQDEGRRLTVYPYNNNLTDGDVLEVLAHAKAGFTSKRISELFSVPTNTINEIVKKYRGLN